MDKCPPFNDFFYPLMQLALDEEVRVRDAAERIADHFGLSVEARLDMVPSGSKARYMDRAQWAATYLRQAGLLNSTRLGYVTVSDDGRRFLSSLSGDEIRRSHLMKFPKFRAFVAKSSKREPKVADDSKGADIPLTPMEQISDALKEIEIELSRDMLEQLTMSPPAFFERVVIDLLMAMGYGGDNKDAGRVTGKAGDNGIDGVIDQDRLGLDQVYIQAKRYASDKSVGSEAIKTFIGALGLYKAGKGLFVTTSSFTKSAYETAEKVSQRIILIDGQRLTRLMINHGVGCTKRRDISIMQIDRDYFE